MTKKEAIDLLDNLIGMVEDNHNSDYDTALKMAIKALEQEPILDKIRAEIVEMRKKQNCSCADCLDIIDKYRLESEE